MPATLLKSSNPDTHSGLKERESPKSYALTLPTSSQNSHAHVYAHGSSQTCYMETD